MLIFLFDKMVLLDHIGLGSGINWVRNRVDLNSLGELGKSRFIIESDKLTGGRMEPDVLLSLPFLSNQDVVSGRDN